MCVFCRWAECALGKRDWLRWLKDSNRCVKKKKRRKRNDLSKNQQVKNVQVLDVSQAKGPVDDLLRALEALPHLRVLNLSDLHVKEKKRKESG